MAEPEKQPKKSSSPRKTEPVPKPRRRRTKPSTVKTGIYYGDIPPRHRPKKVAD